MREPQQNYYGSLCTEMYELLHKKAPEDELNFYLSYAEQGLKILEPPLWQRPISCPLYGTGLPHLRNGPVW